MGVCTSVSQTNSKRRRLEGLKPAANGHYCDNDDNEVTCMILWMTIFDDPDFKVSSLDRSVVLHTDTNSWVTMFHYFV